MVRVSLVLLVAICGCGSSGVIRSSLRACDFSQPCAAGEICDVSQVCGPPAPDAGSACGQVEGDRLCHRDCKETQDCAEGETCTQVTLFDRTDYALPSWICL